MQAALAFARHQLPARVALADSGNGGFVFWSLEDRYSRTA